MAGLCTLPPGLDKHSVADHAQAHFNSPTWSFDLRRLGIERRMGRWLFCSCQAIRPALAVTRLFSISLFSQTHVVHSEVRKAHTGCMAVGNRSRLAPAGALDRRLTAEDFATKPLPGNAKHICIRATVFHTPQSSGNRLRLALNGYIMG